jgi:hypothetical protein
MIFNMCLVFFFNLTLTIDHKKTDFTLLVTVLTSWSQPIFADEGATVRALLKNKKSKKYV